MLLGLSGNETDLDIRPGDLADGAGVPHGALLVRFADASFESATALATARADLVATLGEETMVDAAAVIANFHMMTRIADSTGTPLDGPTEDHTAELRASLGLNNLASMRIDKVRMDKVNMDKVRMEPG